MSNKAIIEKTIEALEARGFSNAEAVQMVRRIQSGNDENLPQAETISTEQFNKIYQEGYKAGHADALLKMSRDRQGEAYTGQWQTYSEYIAAQQRRYSEQAAQSGLYNPCRGEYSYFGNI